MEVENDPSEPRSEQMAEWSVGLMKLLLRDYRREQD